MRKQVTDGMKIGLPLAVLVFVTACWVEAQAGLWRSTPTGVTTTGTITTTNTGAGSISAAGGIVASGAATIGDGIAVTSNSGALGVDIKGRSADDLGAVRLTNFAGNSILGSLRANGSGLHLGANGPGGAAALSMTTSAITPNVRINSGSAQPGFLAYNASTVTGALPGDQVPFGTEVYDTASNFSSSTFTAPVTGIYELCSVVHLTNVSSGTFTLVIQTSNRSYSLGGTQSTTSTAQRASECVPADMDAGDTAIVTINDFVTSADIFGSSIGLRTRFSGRLLP